MKVKTYTKKDVATEMATRHNLSLRNSQEVVDDFFDILRGYLIEDKPYSSEVYFFILYVLCRKRNLHQSQLTSSIHYSNN